MRALRGAEGAEVQARRGVLLWSLLGGESAEVLGARARLVLGVPGASRPSGSEPRAMSVRLPTASIRVLLGPETSRPNKLALVAEHRRRGFVVRYAWRGLPLRSRLAFSFGPGEPLLDAESYEDDVAPLLLWQGLRR